MKAVAQDSLAANFRSRNSNISVMGSNNQVFISNPLSEQPERHSITGADNSQSEPPERPNPESEGII